MNFPDHLNMSDNPPNVFSSLESDIQNILRNAGETLPEPSTGLRPNVANTPTPIGLNRTVLENHVVQLDLLNNLINRYYNRHLEFEDGIRQLIGLTRTTITQQNTYYNTHFPNQTPRRTAANMQEGRGWRYNDDIPFSYATPSRTTNLFQTATSRGRNVLHLSSQEIERATETVAYSLDMGEELCPISLENFTVGENICQIRHCRHIFKTEPLMIWFRRNVKCPVCRYDLRNNGASASSTNTSGFGFNPTARTMLLPAATTPLQTNFENSLFNGLSTIIDELQQQYMDDEERTFTFEFPLYIADSSSNTIL